MSRRAVILAGGRGTRLKPYTIVLPKPLMPIGEYPILEVVVRQLSRAGFTRITMAVNHQAELIKAFFGDGSKWGVAIDYSLEDKALGTMAPLKLIDDLPEDFLVMNGDILTDLDFADFHDEHVFKKRLFTISAHLRTQTIEYGVLESDSDDYLIEFREKPKISAKVAMGIYMVNSRALSVVPNSIPFGFDNLMLEFLSLKEKVFVRQFDGYWLDIGRPDDYSQAIDEFEKNRQKFLEE